MIFHMDRVRTTLVLDPQRLIELKRLAAEQRRTLSSVVDEALRLGLQRHQQVKSAPIRLPTFKMGLPRVNLANRDQLLDFMEV